MIIIKAFIKEGGKETMPLWPTYPVKHRTYKSKIKIVSLLLES